jgi:ABC-type transport system involved in multi-copper enzyme maturation permease subunit
MTMFLRLLDIETRKLLKHPLLWLEFAALLGIFSLYFAVRFALIASAVRQGLSDTRGLEFDLQIGLGLFSFLGILFQAATASLVCAGDYPDNNVQMWLARGVPRPLLVLARLFITLAFGFVLVVVAVFATLGQGALMRTIFLGGYSTQNLDWAQVLPAILRMYWATVPYLALSALLAAAGRSPLFAAGGALVFRTVLENLLLNLIDRFPRLIRLLPVLLAFVLEYNTWRVDRSAHALPLGDQFVTEPQAILAISALLLLCGGLSIFFFSRQDWGG